MNIKSSLAGLIMVLLLVGCSLPGALVKPATPTPSSTPTLTPTQTATPTLPPSPTPTLTPTPLPAVRISAGDHALSLGDFDQAQQEFQSVMTSTSDAEMQAASLLGIGRVYYQTGLYQQALDTFRSLVEKYPGSPASARAYYFLSQVYNILQRYAEAADAYNQYLKLSPGKLDAFVQEQLGDALTASGDYAAANSAYQNALQSPHLGSADWLQIKIGQSYADGSDYKAAITQYQAISSQSNNDAIKAQAGLLEGQAYQALGQTQEAFNAWSAIVVRYPRSYESYSALVALVNAGVPVSDLDRGLVDYFAGQYSLSVEALNRFLTSSAEQDATALHYQALALRALGEQKYPPGSTLRTLTNAQGGVPEDLEAIAAWRTLISTFPNDRFWSDAWDEIAYTQWAHLDQPKDSAQTMLDFVTQNPTHSRAAEFLFYAGRYQERAGLLQDATKTWARMGDEYPTAPETFQGLFFAGIIHFRLNDPSAAQIDFDRALKLASNPTDQSAAQLWIGKALKAQNFPSDASTAWQTAVTLDPTGYYSERARELLLDRPIFDAPQAIDLAADLPTEQREAESWLRTTFKLQDDVNLSDLDSLAEDPRIIRGREFWTLGLYEDARTEFEDVRQAVQSDPVNTFRLLPLFVELGFYRSATLASRQVLLLAGMDDAASLTAPIYFNHIRFGTYYKNQVLPLAETEGFSPLLIFSLIRQESLFESFIQSSAGAVGLMQLMPATAQNIVDRLGWPPNYSLLDLVRPVVNLRLGVDYLAQQRQLFDGDFYAMLAAYNGGPGNTNAWKELAPNDPDLFLESVRIQETRDYIMRLVETYNIYRTLYSRNP